MDLKQSDTEFYNIMENFINEVSNKSELLSNKQKELIKIVSLITQQSKELLLYEIENALSLGLTPIEIKEAV